MLNTEENKTKQTASEAVQELRGNFEEISRNLARLTDVYVAQDIERSDYLERRRSLMSDKKSIEEQIARFLQTPSAWIEPTREWIKDASILDEISKTADLPSKKLSLQKIFGLNLHLKSRQVFGNPFKHYASLREARENFVNNDLSLILAETVRFELTIEFPQCRFSKPVPSTTQPRLRIINLTLFAIFSKII